MQIQKCKSLYKSINTSKYYFLRSSDDGAGQCSTRIQELCDPEIANFNQIVNIIMIFSQENIGGF